MNLNFNYCICGSEYEAQTQRSKRNIAAGRMLRLRERGKAMKNMIEIRHLKKAYGEVRAVDDLSFRVREGELFAFLGVNGAGKSTTIGMMCGQISRDAGEIIIDGRNPQEDMDSVRKSLGVVFQNSALDKQLSVLDNLKSRSALYGISGRAFEERLKELNKLLGLEELLKRTLGKLSGGQRRRIDIARAILHKPKILILDEPTTGLDPQTRQTVWSVVDSLRRNENMTVFLTTHYMEEAADADYVVILDAGRIAAEGTPLELKNAYTGDFITLYHAKAEDVKLLGAAYEKIGTEGTYRISVPDTAAATKLILAHPEVFSDYEIVKGKMDDVFLAVTGKRQEGTEA